MYRSLSLFNFSGSFLWALLYLYMSIFIHIWAFAHSIQQLTCAETEQCLRIKGNLYDKPKCSWIGIKYFETYIFIRIPKGKYDHHNVIRSPPNDKCGNDDNGHPQRFHFSSVNQSPSVHIGCEVFLLPSYFRLENFFAFWNNKKKDKVGVGSKSVFIFLQNSHWLKRQIYSISKKLKINEFHLDDNGDYICYISILITLHVLLPGVDNKYQNSNNLILLQGDFS